MQPAILNKIATALTVLSNHRDVWVEFVNLNRRIKTSILSFDLDHLIG